MACIVDELEDRLAAVINAVQNAIYRQSGPLQGTAITVVELEMSVNGKAMKVTATVPCRLIEESQRIEFSKN